MGLREIPSLSTLCLRVVGNPKCKVDKTFAPTKDGKLSSASKLLRSFHDRPVLGSGETVGDYLRTQKDAIESSLDGGADNHDDGDDDENDNENESSLAAVAKVPTLERIPMKRTPAIGVGSGRRKQANDVDLNHPWIATYLPPSTSENDDDDSSSGGDGDGDNDNDENYTKYYCYGDTVPKSPQEQELVAESGSCALDLLQSYVDALVEMGRMDDNRLGIRFFAEYKANIELQYKAALPIEHEHENTESAIGPTTTPFPPQTLVAATPAPVMDTPIPKKKKRKRSSGGAFSAAKKKKEAEARAAAEAKRQAAVLAAVPKSRGSLSLHNCEVLTETTSNLLNSRVLEHIHALDLTGLQTLTDAVLSSLLQSAGLQLERLSIKNCRRLTDASIHTISATNPNLKALDCGGDYNLRPRTLLDALAVKVTKRGRGVFTSQALVHLVELHAGGIGPAGGWTDDQLVELFALRGWRALSIGFSPHLTFVGWKAAILSVERKFRDVEEHQQRPPQGDDDDSDGPPPPTSNHTNGTKSTHNPKNMCHTLQSLAVAFCEQQLVDNAWMGLVGRHLPNLRALDVRGNHQLHSMTSWYDGRATISGSPGRVHPKQSLMVLGRYSGISANGIEETKRIYPLAASPLTVVLESDGIGWGILRQELRRKPSSKRGAALDHYEKRLAAAKDAAVEAPAAKAKDAFAEATKPAATAPPATAEPTAATGEKSEPKAVATTTGGTSESAATATTTGETSEPSASAVVDVVPPEDVDMVDGAGGN